MSNKCCSGTGKEGKTKEVVKDRTVKKIVCDTVVCERWCVTKTDGVWQSCVWKMVCVKVVWKRVCDKVVCERWCAWKLCVKESVWQSCETRSSLARTYGTNTHLFSWCTGNVNCGGRDFFQRWVRTIGEVPGSSASDMQQCGNSEAIDQN